LYANPLPPGEEPHAVSTTAKPVNTCGCGALSAPAAIGPFIRCSGYDPGSKSWTGSVLFIAKPSVSAKPVLSWTVKGSSKPVAVVAGQCLDVFCEWNFWRFVLVIPVEAQEQVVQYWIDNNTGDAATFYVAGEREGAGTDR
jgi:hypothetical protein